MIRYTKNILVMYSTSFPSSEHLEKLGEIASDYKIINVKSEEAAVSYAKSAEVILGHRYLWQTLPFTENLKWIQSSAGGIDHLITKELIRISPVLTRTPIFSDIIAFHAISLAFSIIRKTYTSKNQDTGGIPKKVMIFGTGLIGQEIASFLKGFPIEIYGVNSGKSKNIMNFKKIYGFTENWKDFLPEINVFFICSPLTPITKNSIDKTVFEKLPEKSVIVNIGRGQIIDHYALIKFLDSGKISAGLDVLDGVDPELKTMLLKHKNAIITPKNSTMFPERNIKYEEFIESQLKRYISGKPLQHIVNYSHSCY